MTQLPQRPIHHGGAAGTSSGGAAGAALWLIACGCFGLAGVARGQQSYLTLSNASVTSGSFTYQAGTSITAKNGFAVSGCATVTLASGNSIILGPGFTATAGGTGGLVHPQQEPTPSPSNLAPRQHTLQGCLT